MDQASELRRIMAQAGGPNVVASPIAPVESPTRHAARFIAVTSGKGGVGKTNVAVNLAARLATMGRRVILLDADLGLANADVLVNITPRANLAHVVAGRRRLEEAMCDAPGGFTLIPGASGLSQMADLTEFERARLLQMLRQIETQHDLVIIDTGAGISPNVLSFILASDEVLVVTTPEPTAITDAYALIKTVTRRKEDAHISLLVNQVRDRGEGRRVFDRINAVTRRFLGLSILDAGFIVSDPRVSAAVRRRSPFVLDEPDCPASACVTQLAHKLDRHAAEPGNIGFFKRVAGWLVG
ncbi:MAG: MinD/ParA family protein [Phycisphaeraceae bacterium]